MKIIKRRFLKINNIFFQLLVIFNRVSGMALAIGHHVSLSYIK